jgi:5-methyltetrahydrofolate--homocysteine methyltransferase
MHGLEGELEAINRQAVEAVRRAVGDRALVSASVGPSGRLLEPFGDASPEEVEESFAAQLRVLARAGADVFCIETMGDLNEATLAVAAARAVAPTVPVMATMTFEPTPRGFFTMMGVSVEKAATGLQAAGVDVVGSNCGTGIGDMVGIARQLVASTRLPVLIQPNAGLPETRDGVLVYRESPESMASRVPELLDLGVSIIGGCCGTTPEHVRALRRAVDAGRARVSRG